MKEASFGTCPVLQSCPLQEERGPATDAAPAPGPPPAPLLTSLGLADPACLPIPSRPWVYYNDVGVVSFVFRLQAWQVCRRWHTPGCGNFPETL